MCGKTWQQYFKQLANLGAECLRLEDSAATQKCLEAELIMERNYNPTRKSNKFYWETDPETDFQICKCMSHALALEMQDGYGPKQQHFDSIHWEWDVST